jgi:hypothetical protein
MLNGDAPFDGVGTYAVEESTLWSTFWTDVCISARAWRFAPALPVTAGAILLTQCGLGALGSVSDWLVLPALVVLLFSAGFAGTLRVWYLHSFHHERFAPSEVWTLTGAFLGRYVWLGLILGIVGAAITFILYAAVGELAGVGATIGWWLIMDFALTFVTPALAYTTRSARHALTIGLRTIRETWPMCACYVLTPGLASVALVWSAPRSLLGPWGTAAIGITVGAIALLVKGAIAAFYLRRYEPPTAVGAAYFNSGLRDTHST